MINSMCWFVYLAYFTFDVFLLGISKDLFTWRQSPCFTCISLPHTLWTAPPDHIKGSCGVRNWYSMLVVHTLYDFHKITVSFHLLHLLSLVLIFYWCIYYIQRKWHTLVSLFIFPIFLYSLAEHKYIKSHI